VSITDTVFVNITESKPVWNYFVFSARPEFVVSQMKDGITAIGASAEFGVIIPSSIYFSGDLSGGMFYAGGGGNVGYCFNKDGFIKVVSGVNAGFYYAQLKVEFTRGDKKVADAEGGNKSFAGVFVKLMGGKASNFDVSYKLMFGRNEIPIMYKDKDKDVLYEKGLGMRHSLGLGYALMKRKYIK
jgi:hypothetical protein